MDKDTLTKIVDGIADSHMRDTGQWIAEAGMVTVLHYILTKYETAAFRVIKEIEDYVQDGSYPEGMREDPIFGSLINAE